MPSSVHQPPVNSTSSPYPLPPLPLPLSLFLLLTRRPHPSPRAVPNARSARLYGTDDPRHSVTFCGARKTLPSPDEICDPQTSEEALTRSDATQQTWTPLAGAGSRPSNKWRSTRSHVRRITRSSIGSDPNQMFALDMHKRLRKFWVIALVVGSTTVRVVK